MNNMLEIKGLTIEKIIKKQVKERGEKIFINYVTGQDTYTFREVHLISNQIANNLISLGVTKGTHVASLMFNSPEQIFLYLALGKIGAVSIPINTASRGAFLEYYVNQSDTTAIVVESSLLPILLEILPRTNISLVCVLGSCDELDIDLKQEFVDFRSLMRGDDSDPVIEVSHSDLSAINYTSGTTGPSKGNVYTQAAALYFATNLMELLSASERDTYYVCFPLFHAAAWNSAVLPMLQLGGTVALTRRFSAYNYIDEARKSHSTIFNLLSVGSFLLSQPPSPEDRNHRLRIGLAAPMPTNAEEFEKRFGVILTGAFGLSDYACPFGLDPVDRARKRYSVGRPLKEIEVRLVDGDDFEVPTGVPGELVVRHKLPWVTPTGYYKMPDVTAESRKNLWFHTGDRMYRDEEGFYYFVDRKKDAIRRRGENISSFEVESAIAMHEGVAEVAVVGIRADTGEDDVAVAIVKAAAADICEKDIASFCESRLPKYMWPRFVVFVDSLPKTLTEKIEKHKIRDMMRDKIGDLWDKEREMP